ncbi:PI-actitoxin-Aeq3a-like [Ostrinia furnacalis]|uniref:PI-actitoxin-Aeq3a-like n=1 Tax=Ostrinia furnacalis TaxID=93504 RepID=UPI00103A6968|nr:PI-actitoxin-Aeq3a-like [Ostrinia furnacalis]
MKNIGILVFLVAITLASSLDKRCKLPLVSGRCLAYLPSYGYRVETGKCERFIYGGCEGNKNRFETRKECEAVCN